MSEKQGQIQEIRTKVYYHDQIRRFTFVHTTDFKKFISFVQDLYPGIDSSVSYKYQDEEGEYVTFSTENEWKEALKQNFEILRIVIEDVKKEKGTFDVKPGDVVYELNDKEVKKYLRTGEIDIKLPSSGHVGVICDGCNDADFHGDRWQCRACSDFDFCGKCMVKYGEKHFGGEHKFERIKESACKFSNIVSHVIHEKKCKKEEKKDDQVKSDRRLAKELEKEEKKQAKLHRREEREKIKDELLKQKKSKKELVVEKIEKKPNSDIILIPRVERVEEKKAPIILIPQVSDKVAPGAKKEETKKTLVPEFKEVKVSPPIVEIVQPSAPKLEEAKEFKKDEKYSIHYKILENMGFTNSEVTTNLLKQHAGNLQKVVDALLGQ